MKNLIINICFFLPIMAISQNEIDKLVEKYGENQFIIYTAAGELQVKSKILKHEESTPFSVIIYGEVDLESDLEMSIGGGKSCKIVASFLLDVIMQKKSDGYKLISDNTGAFQYNMNKNFICSYRSFRAEFGKSNYIFRASREFIQPNSKWIQSASHPMGGYFQQQSSVIKFSIEMIDKSRIGTKESKNFKF